MELGSYKVICVGVIIAKFKPFERTDTKVKDLEDRSTTHFSEGCCRFLGPDLSRRESNFFFMRNLVLLLSCSAASVCRAL